MNKLFCFLLAGGKGTRLKPLTNKQSKAMVNICSSYHLIDFALASSYVANIDNLGVITQYAQDSLIDYLMDWKTFINYKLTPANKSQQALILLSHNTYYIISKSSSV